MTHSPVAGKLPAALLACFVLLLLGTAPLTAQARWSAPFLRHPCPSPDGDMVTFSYGGDIWIVPARGGAARRITVHEAHDAHPLWSPGGGLIAFCSDRAGQNDIFVVDTAGSSPVQLTFHESSDLPAGWTPDGLEVIFLASREFSPKRIPTPYRVRADGGSMPRKLWPVIASGVAVSPDGGRCLFSRGYNPWYRKGYRGSGNQDIWLFGFADSTYRQLTSLDADESTPMWSADGGSLFYVAEYNGVPNICRRSLDDPPESPGQALTSFETDGVRWARPDRDCSLIAFERGTDIYLLDTRSGGGPRRLQVSLPGDMRGNRTVWKTFASEAQALDVSPDCDQAAVVVHGELFVVEDHEEGVTRRITETVARENHPRWMPDSTTVLFAGDSLGNYDIYSVRSAPGEPGKLYRANHRIVERLTDGPEEEHLPLPSPDGKKIAYVRGRGDLMVMDADGGNERVLVEGWDTPDFSWSPDSRWIAYSRNDIDFNQDVWVIPADGSAEPVNISKHPDSDSSPVFTGDGGKLAFLSRRSGDNNIDIYFVYLTREEMELAPEQRRWREEKKDKSGDEGEDSPPAVEIEFEDIHHRLVRVTSFAGDEGPYAVSPDGKTVVFASSMDGERDLYSISWDGGDLERLTTGGHSPGGLSFSADGGTVYYIRSGGRPSKVGVPDGKPGSLPMKARMDIDQVAEKVHVFNEGWRVLDEYFYDPEFHGVDWKALRDKYLPAVEAGIPARPDFDDIMRLMMGELNASHLGIYPPDDGRQQVPVGALGIRLDESYPGEGFRVELVFEGGPAWRVESRLYPGDVITAVEGRPAARGSNLYHMLYDRVGRPTVLEVRGAESGKPREVVIRPVSCSAQRNLLYRHWVKTRRELTEKLSNGRLGYIHIRAMGWDSFEHFERDLFAECDGRQGLIVDVRDNPGGWITDYLLAVLHVERHARTIPRGARESGYPQERLPLYSWTKPVAALCNELSFSNAEIFSHAFKTLGLGKLIGMETGGAVISTGGTTLIDGSVFRVPFRGWYVVGSGINMEKKGAVPDITVPQPPGEEGSTEHDSQLERAVRELLEEIGG